MMRIMPRPGDRAKLNVQQGEKVDPEILELLGKEGPILPRPKREQVRTDSTGQRLGNGNQTAKPDKKNKPLFPTLYAELVRQKESRESLLAAETWLGGVGKSENSKVINVDAISGAAISSNRQEKPLGWFARIVNDRLSRKFNPEKAQANEGEAILNFLFGKDVEAGTDSTAIAAWYKRLGKPYNSKFLPDNGDGSVRLPDNVASQINSDTTTAMSYIQSIDSAISENNNYLSKLSKIQTPESINQYNLVKSHTDALGKLKELHKTTLNSLREINTVPGKKAVFNEYGVTDPKLIMTRDTTDFTPYTLMNENPTPANVLQNFTMWKDNNGITHYYDIYDLNNMEGIMTRTMRDPFKIQGTTKK